MPIYKANRAEIYMNGERLNIVGFGEKQKRSKKTKRRKIKQTMKK